MKWKMEEFHKMIGENDDQKYCIGYGKCTVKIHDPNVCLQAYVEDEKDRDLIRKELFQGPEWAQGDLGVITNAERYDGVSRRVPERLHTALRNCVDHWMMCMKPLPGAKAFCDGLKKKGIICICCSMRIYHL